MVKKNNFYYEYLFNSIKILFLCLIAHQSVGQDKLTKLYKKLKHTTHNNWNITASTPNFITLQHNEVSLGTAVFGNGIFISHYDSLGVYHPKGINQNPITEASGTLVVYIRRTNKHRYKKMKHLEKDTPGYTYNIKWRGMYLEIASTFQNCEYFLDKSKDSSCVLLINKLSVNIAKNHLEQLLKPVLRKQLLNFDKLLYIDKTF